MTTSELKIMLLFRWATYVEKLTSLSRTNLSRSPFRCNQWHSHKCNSSQRHYTLLHSNKDCWYIRRDLQTKAMVWMVQTRVFRDNGTRVRYHNFLKLLLKSYELLILLHFFNQVKQWNYSISGFRQKRSKSLISG